jgi:hypothetical protein
MHPVQQALLQRADELLSSVDRVIATRKYLPQRGDFVDAAMLAGARAGVLSFIKGAFGADHPFFAEMQAKVDKPYLSSATILRSVLDAARGEIAGGWSGGLRRLVSAELLADFLEMADALRAQSYHTAAAVLTGCALEEHLRELARAHNIPLVIEKDDRLLPVKADRLNAELVRSGAYSQLDAKSITAWLDLRNKAAHGLVSEYTPAQVDHMYLGVTEALARLVPRGTA